jgi:hypothetical protein
VKIAAVLLASLLVSNASDAAPFLRYPGVYADYQRRIVVGVPSLANDIAKQTGVNEVANRSTATPAALNLVTASLKNLMVLAKAPSFEGTQFIQLYDAGPMKGLYSREMSLAEARTYLAKCEWKKTEPLWNGKNGEGDYLLARYDCPNSQPPGILAAINVQSGKVVKITFNEMMLPIMFDMAGRPVPELKP